MGQERWSVTRSEQRDESRQGTGRATNPRGRCEVKIQQEAGWLDNRNRERSDNLASWGGERSPQIRPATGAVNKVSRKRRGGRGRVTGAETRRRMTENVIARVSETAEMLQFHLKQRHIIWT